MFTIADRRAYIGRGVDREFFGYITDIATGQSVYDEGEWSDVETALAWARARANEVVLTYGASSDTVFSAGISYYRGSGDTPVAQWPPDDSVKAAIDRAVRGELDDPQQSDVGRLRVERPEIQDDRQYDGRE
jgi:hypothetical protein